MNQKLRQSTDSSIVTMLAKDCSMLSVCLVFCVINVCIFSICLQSAVKTAFCYVQNCTVRFGTMVRFGEIFLAHNKWAVLKNTSGSLPFGTLPRSCFETYSSVNDQLTDWICNHVMEHIELCCNLCDTLTDKLTYTDSRNACSTMWPTFMKRKSIWMDMLVCKKIKCINKEMHMKLKRCNCSLTVVQWNMVFDGLANTTVFASSISNRVSVVRYCSLTSQSLQSHAAQLYWGYQQGSGIHSL